MRRQANVRLAAWALALAFAGSSCGTLAMAELVARGDGAARITSAWTTAGGGLALLLDGMETAWTEGPGLLALTPAELERALADERALAVDGATPPQTLLPRERLLLDWCPGDGSEPVLLEEVPATRADASDWSGVHADGVDAAERPLRWRVVYRVDRHAPEQGGQRLLSVLVVSRDPGTAEMRRAVFHLAGYERGFLREAALVGFGVGVDIGMLALLTL